MALEVLTLVLYIYRILLELKQWDRPWKYEFVVLPILMENKALSRNNNL